MTKKCLCIFILLLLALCASCSGGEGKTACTPDPSVSTEDPSAPQETQEPDNRIYIKVFVPVRSDVAVLSGDEKYYPEGDSNCEYISVPAEPGDTVTLEAIDGLIYTFRSWSGDVTSKERTVEITASEGAYLSLDLDIHYGENIALGAKVTCVDSEEQGTTYTAENLTDGSYLTSFYAQPEDASKLLAITVDLGSIQEISLVSLAPARDALSGQLLYAYPEFVSIRLSTDGAAYTEVGAYSGQTPSGGHLTHYSFVSSRARYVRILVKAVGEPVGFSEIEIR